jgi:acetyltransferase
MTTNNQLEAFINPKSVAVIGATERPGSWGSFIMNGLLSAPFSGRIYPVNQKAEQVFGLPAFKSVADIPDSPELAVFTIPEQWVEQNVEECGRKGVKGISIVSAGFG